MLTRRRDSPGAHQYQVTARPEVKLFANLATNYPGDAVPEPSPSLWEVVLGPAGSIPLPKAAGKGMGTDFSLWPEAFSP